MAFRLASCKTLLKACSGSSKAMTSLKNIPVLNYRGLYKTTGSSLHYTQSRGIFWGEKKGEQGQTEKPTKEGQAETTGQTETKQEAETQTKETQENTSKQEETTTSQKKATEQQTQSQKTAEQPKKAPKKEAATPETFDGLLENPTPENKKKLHALWTKLEKEVQDKAQEVRKAKSLADALDKASEDHSKKLNDLRARLKEEIEERELMRKRTDKEVDQSKVFAITKFAKDLIEVPDNLNRALDAAKGLEGKADPLYDGVKSTYNILLKVLAKHGVNQIDPVGEKFDPNFHEALFDFEDPSKEAGTCGFVANVGYLINERVLRPAKVGVVKGTPGAAQPKKKENASESD